MRFLADENVPASLVQELKKVGHDVAWVRTAQPGSPDREILAWAAREERVLVTFDKDFGELARQAELPSSCGIVLFRLGILAPRSGAALARRLDARNDWSGNFSVIEPDRVRMRPLAKF